MTTVFIDGRAGLDFSEGKAKEILMKKEIEIKVSLGNGEDSSIAWGRALTYSCTARCASLQQKEKTATDGDCSSFESSAYFDTKCTPYRPFVQRYKGVCIF